MITQEEIESIGFEMRLKCRNGGTLGFVNKESTLVIMWSGDNFIYKRDCPERLSEIEIKTFDGKVFKDIETFNPLDLKELQERLSTIEI